jgi:hypothetical protein
MMLFAGNENFFGGGAIFFAGFFMPFFAGFFIGFFTEYSLVSIRIAQRLSCCARESLSPFRP